jgi:hypothetical protein
VKFRAITRIIINSPLGHVYFTKFHLFPFGAPLARCLLLSAEGQTHGDLG